jgi:NMD protein affecting ribosome stability and mRNA decay
MVQKDTLAQRIEELASFLDPVAFERCQDCSLAKRRRAAWREAANRINAAERGM